MDHPEHDIDSFMAEVCDLEHLLPAAIFQLSKPTPKQLFASRRGDLEASLVGIVMLGTTNVLNVISD